MTRGKLIFLLPLLTGLLAGTAQAGSCVKQSAARLEANAQAARTIAANILKGKEGDFFRRHRKLTHAIAEESRFQKKTVGCIIEMDFFSMVPSDPVVLKVEQLAESKAVGFLDVWIEIDKQLPTPRHAIKKTHSLTVHRTTKGPFSGVCITPEYRAVAQELMHNKKINEIVQVSVTPDNIRTDMQAACIGFLLLMPDTVKSKPTDEGAALVVASAEKHHFQLARLIAALIGEKRKRLGAHDTY